MALIKFKEEKNRENLLRGFVNHVDSEEPILSLSGRCGSKIYYESSNKKEPQLLIDIESINFAKLQYPSVRLNPISFNST
jgi:hypothetical protein